jgi:hypothetical protein
MCPCSLFVETALGPPEHEKLCIDVLCPKHTGMHYMTQRSHGIQKNKFDVMCPTMLFVESVPSHPNMKDSASMLHALDAAECTT